ncbi:uncharacterized protein LOC106156308 [Lingula anatina]|uniref:Uncharacterized protein LOC106156308 n=1 Tax=Lingula anatina TaxID=7574 RepID=A0A1S3HLR4_LINAN|nr:uncharacterized protein LOC106156308 [Lingula anatina]|eukprot:XP_013386957.1 uncharacterized protein LOC106156308 [Lingula anatina]
MDVEVDLQGCDVCGGSHDTEQCPELGLETTEEDPLSMARLTLPNNLQVVEFLDKAIGVATKQGIPAKTKLGPFEAKRTTIDLDMENLFVLKIFSKDGSTVTLDTRNESECNWLCLVRTAETKPEQNCIAFQSGTELYYMNTRRLDANEELKVWYAPHYAKKLGKSAEPDGVTKALLGLDINWQANEASPNKNTAHGEGEASMLYICQLCEISFNSESEFRQHLLELHNMALTEEQEGQQDGIHQAADIAPVLTFSQESSDASVCRECNATFDSMVSLARHIRNHLRPQLPVERKMTRTRKSLVCSICGQACRSPITFKRHMRKHKKQGVKCPECAMFFYREDLLESHMESKHQKTSSEETKVKVAALDVEAGKDGSQPTDENEQMFIDPSQAGTQIVREGATQDKTDPQVAQDLEDLDKLLSELEGVQTPPIVNDSTSAEEKMPTQDEPGLPVVTPVAIAAPPQIEILPPDQGELKNNNTVADVAQPPPPKRRRGRPRKSEMVKKIEPPVIKEPEKPQEAESEQNLRRSSRGRVIKPRQWQFEAEQDKEFKKNKEGDSDDDDADLDLESGDDITEEEVDLSDDDGEEFVAKLYPMKRKREAATNGDDDGNNSKREALDLADEEIQDPEVLLELQDGLEQKEDDSTYGCPVCGGTFSTLEEGREHMSQEHPDNLSYKCKVCGEVLDKLESGKTHVLEKHREEVVGSKDLDWELNMDIEESFDGKHYVCPECGKKFDKPRYLKNHFPVHTGKYTCAACHKVFARAESLEKHICSAKVEVKKTHFCQICNLSFSKKLYLFRHMAAHTGEFTCERCKTMFSRKKALEWHLYKCNPAQLSAKSKNHVFPCDECGKVFSRQLALENHKIVHTGQFRCSVCKKSYSSKERLQEHVCVGSAAKGGEDGTGGMSSSAKSKFKCELCDKAFIRKEDVLKHEYKCKAKFSIEQDGVVKCDDCGEEFTDAILFRDHKVKHRHPHECAKCGKGFARKFSHLEHEKTCTGKEGAVNCTVCNRTLSDPRYLDRHMQTHEEPNYECEFCGKSFYRKDYLNNHTCRRPDGSVVRMKYSVRKGVAEMEDKYVCYLCGKTYISKSNLNKHLKTHGDKHFSCDVCHKKFHIRHQMLEHKNAVHTKERKFQCNECGKLLKTRLTLYAHKKQFHGAITKVFACQTCGKIFRQKGNLMKHMLMHDPKKHFNCNYCQASFKYPEQLYRHTLEHTQGKKHACDHCTKKFVLPHELKKHVLEFHSGMMYVCSLCSEMCRYRHTLRRHIQRKHPGNVGMLQDPNFLHTLLKKVDQPDEPRIQSSTISAGRAGGSVVEKPPQHILVQIQDPNQQTRLVEVQGGQNIEDGTSQVIFGELGEGPTGRTIIQMPDGRQIELTDNTEVIHIQQGGEQGAGDAIPTTAAATTGDQLVMENLSSDVVEALQTAQALQSLSSSIDGATSKSINLADLASQIAASQILATGTTGNQMISTTAPSDEGTAAGDQGQYLLVPLDYEQEQHAEQGPVPPVGEQTDL